MKHLVSTLSTYNSQKQAYQHKWSTSIYKYLKLNTNIALPDFHNNPVMADFQSVAIEFFCHSILIL